MPRFKATITKKVIKRVEVELEATNRDDAVSICLGRGQELMHKSLDQLTSDCPIFDFSDLIEISTEEPKPYDVYVDRRTETSTVIRVYAHDTDEARRKAIKESSSLDFKGKPERVVGLHAIALKEVVGGQE